MAGIRRMVVLVLLVLLVSSLPVTSPAAQVKDDAHFYFVQITDTHFGDLDWAERTAKVIDAINNLPMKIECAVHTGDIYADGVTDDVAGQVKPIMKKLRVPIQYVPGNHDILIGNELKQSLSAYEKNVGPLSNKKEYNGVVFLAFWSEPLIGSFKVDRFDPMVWLEKQLKEAGEKPVIILTHSAPVQDFYNNTIHPVWPDGPYHRLKKLMTSHRNVKAIIAGHFHRDDLHWLGNMPVYVSAPVSSYFGRQTAFRIYEYDNGKLSYRTVYLE